MKTWKISSKLWARTSGESIKRFLLIFLLFCPSHLCSEENLTVLAGKAVEKIRAQLPRLRATPQDCSNPPVWKIPLTIPAVQEDLLTSPLDSPKLLSSWSQGILESSSPYDMIKFSCEILKSSSALVRGVGGSASKQETLPSGLPSSLLSSILNIAESIDSAKKAVRGSYSRLTGDERDALLAMYDFPKEGNHGNSLFTPAFKIKSYEAMRKFNQDALMAAAEDLIKTIDHEMPNLKLWAVNLADPLNQEFKSAHWRIGDCNILVSGEQNNFYSTETLKDADLLVALGGNNRYEGPAAGAREGEVKVVIDFGRDVTVISTGQFVSAGAGVFGVGLLYLPQTGGAKTIVSGTFSQGFGLAGVGGLFVDGPGKFKAERYVQGVGIFGAGLFSNDHGDKSAYEADLYGQGVGFTRGVGVFRCVGSSSALIGGMTEPDPRESLGTTSLCQGVGYGPRAYAGGGIGICALKGDDIKVESSYFAQGAGYWQSAGSFYLEGSRCSLKARRYDMGSGIHSAIGGFFLVGNDNHLENWGVGPAFGWDSGIGWSLVYGNRNKVQSEWGAGSASTNGSRSFSVFSGTENKIDLPGLGNAQIARDIPDYAVSVIEGKGNSLKSARMKIPKSLNGQVYATPWGGISLENTLLEQDLGLQKPVWSRLSRDEQAHGYSLGTEVKRSETLNAPEKIFELVQIASSFTTDKVNPRKALTLLLESSRDEIPWIIRSLNPSDFDGFIQIRVLTSILGSAAKNALWNDLKDEWLKDEEVKDPRRFSALLSLLGLIKPEDGITDLYRGLDHRDWRIQSVCARTIGLLYNANRGYPPGRLTILRMLEEWLSERSPSHNLTDELTQDLNKITYVETMSFISACAADGEWSVPERLELLETAPEDINGNLDDKGAEKLLSFLKNRRKESLKNLRRALKREGSYLGMVRNKLLKVLEISEGRRELIHAVLIALGEIGRGADAGVIAPYLDHKSSLVREAASISLGRLGKNSLSFLEKAMATSDKELKAQAILAVCSSSDSSLYPILENGLSDPDPYVRKTALAALDQIQSPVAKDLEKIKEKARKISASNEPADVALQRLFQFGQEK